MHTCSYQGFVGYLLRSIEVGGQLYESSKLKLSIKRLEMAILRAAREGCRKLKIKCHPASRDVYGKEKLCHSRLIFVLRIDG